MELKMAKISKFVQIINKGPHKIFAKSLFDRWAALGRLNNGRCIKYMYKRNGAGGSNDGRKGSDYHVLIFAASRSLANRNRVCSWWTNRILMYHLSSTLDIRLNIYNEKSEMLQLYIDVVKITKTDRQATAVAS